MFAVRTSQLLCNMDVDQRMNRFYNYCTLIIVLCFCSTHLVAQAEAEGYSNSYLLRPVGARTIGLSGAYTSSVNEANAMFCNAGALGFQPENVQLSTMFSALSFGRYQSTFAATKNLGSSIGIGLSFNSLTSPGFHRYDGAGNPLGIATFQQYSAGLGVGATIANVGMGAVAKYIVNNMDAAGLKASGFAFDLGAKMPFAQYFNLGLAVQNIGSVQWNNSSSLTEQLPWVIRCGLSTEIPLSNEEYVQRSTTLGENDTVHVPASRYVLVALEMNYARSAMSPQIILASEFAVSELLSVRAGLGLLGDDFGETKLLPMTTYSAGLSYRIHAPELPFQLQIDYAAAHEFTSSNSISHHFSLIVGL